MVSVSRIDSAHASSKHQRQLNLNLLGWGVGKTGRDRVNEGGEGRRGGARSSQPLPLPAQEMISAHKEGVAAAGRAIDAMMTMQYLYRRARHFIILVKFSLV